jgi:hypothetical protein
MGAGERLFGSITAADVAEELSRTIGSVVDKKKIDIEKPFRQAGSYEILVKLATDIKPRVTVVVEEEEEKETEQKAEKKQEKEEKQEKKKRKAKAKEEEEVKEEKKE